MRILKTIVLFTTLLSITACSSGVKVTTDQAERIDFSTYQSFTFLGWQKDSEENISTFDKQRLHDAFLHEFNRRNIQKKDKGGDMSVVLYLVIDEKTSTTAYTDYYGGGYGRYGRYGRGWGGGYSTTTYTQSDYLQGTLVMDVFDEVSGKQIWQAVAVGTITEDPEKREKTIPQNVAKLMQKFPVAPVK